MQNRIQWGIALLCAILAGPATAEPSGSWTLEQAIRQGLAVSPEREVARQRVEARRGQSDQAGRWANPQLSLRASDELGRQDGTGGYSLKELEIAQSLPLWGRLGHRRAAARADVEAARLDATARRLRLEGRIARAFHDWQLAAARYRLTRQRREVARQLEEVAGLREEAGDLAERERLRIQVARSEVQRRHHHAEGNLTEARTTLAGLLAVSPDSLGRPPELRAPPDPGAALPPPNDHPALQAMEAQITSAREQTDAARTEGWPDVGLRLFSERNIFDGQRENSLGMGLMLELPLWDRNQGAIQRARAEQRIPVEETRALRRDLRTRIRVSNLHLAHLLKELDRHRSELLDPARRILEMTERGYRAGEASLLEWLEAEDTWYSAREREQTILARAWEEWRRWRISTGRSLAEENP
ncbi:MAG: TolC family protein [Pseudomonadota bacterium]